MFSSDTFNRIMLFSHRKKPKIFIYLVSLVLTSVEIWRVTD